MAFTPLSYQIIPNIIFIFSVLGILLIILRHLPQAAVLHEIEEKEPNASEKLLAKGLPAEAFSKIRVTIKLWIKKTWNFMLEAKDLKPHAAAGYRIKQLFSRTQPPEKKPIVQPITTHEVKDERYYLDMIKLQPKNLTNYDALGKFYMERENFVDAADIFQYLANHEPANPDFHARLAYCLFRNKQYSKAAEHYRKSIALDSTQPNRYYNLGLSLEAAGQWTEAITSFEHAISLENKNIKYFISLSQASLKAGDKEKAKAALMSAKAIDPENPTVIAKLEKLTIS